MDRTLWSGRREPILSARLIRNRGDFENIYALAVDPQRSDTVYVAGYKGLLKSRDRGESWSAIDFGLPGGGGIPSALAIDPDDSNIVYVSVFGPGILRSADGGKTWIDANFGSRLLDVRMLGIDPGNPGTIYVGTGYGAFELTFVP